MLLGQVRIPIQFEICRSIKQSPAFSGVRSRMRILSSKSTTLDCNHKLGRRRPYGSLGVGQAAFLQLLKKILDDMAW